MNACKLMAVLALTVAGATAANPAIARKASLFSSIANELSGNNGPGLTNVQLQHGAQVSIGFSPDAGAEMLVISAIESARTRIRVSAYSFTSAPIVSALLSAKKRGVDVQVIVDLKSNTSDDRSGKATHALNALANAGIPVRTTKAYAIHHDKVMVIDSATVETGSFNYSDAASHRNSENVMVVWNQPAIGAVYEKHWQSRFNKGSDWDGRE